MDSSSLELDEVSIIVEVLYKNIVVVNKVIFYSLLTVNLNFDYNIVSKDNKIIDKPHS